MRSLYRVVPLVLLLSAACTSGVTPTPTITPSVTSTARFSTHEGPIVRATLPPTWTPTPTPLPTETFTPTPVTPTLTASPVPSLADLCDSLQVVSGFDDGHVFQWTDTIEVFFGTQLTTVADPDTGALITLTVRFLATHSASGENLGAQLAGGQVFGMELPVDQLPLPGDYTWQIAVSGDGIDDQCVHTGSFSVLPPESTPEVTSEATSEATPEITPTY